MMDRGIIKWAPFNSVISSEDVIKDVIHYKNKINKPILSEDQLKEIEILIMTCFHTFTSIEINYFENGYIYKIIDKIKKIDYINKKIYLSNKSLYFSQIINVS